MKVYKRYRGRPEDCGGRAPEEIRTYDFLDSLGIEYDRSDHIAAPSMEVCRTIDRGLEVDTCKNLFLCNRQQTRFYLLMMPGEKPFRTRYLSQQMGISRLSFAKEEYMTKFLGISPGSVSVMGLINDREGRVQLVIDEDVIKNEYIGCHPCRNTSSIRIKTRDLLNVFLPAVNHKPIIVKMPWQDEDA